MKLRTCSMRSDGSSGKGGPAILFLRLGFISGISRVVVVSLVHFVILLSYLAATVHIYATTRIRFVWV